MNKKLTEKEKIEFIIAEFPSSLRALKKTLHSELASDTKYIDDFIDALVEEAELMDNYYSKKKGKNTF